MPFSFDDWLPAHPASSDAVGPLPAAPVEEPLRGTPASQAARWALDGFDVTEIVNANLAPDPVNHGDAWSSGWAQGFARHLAMLVGQALQEGPVAGHVRLATCWHRLKSHPDAQRFMTFARHDLDHRMGSQGWIALEQKVLREAAALSPVDRPTLPRSRL